jgi:hypothetical protein
MSTGLTQLIQSLALMMLIKNLGRHTGAAAADAPPRGGRLVCSLLSQLKCAHLVPAKAPLPEKAIFNRNKAAAERRWAVRKAQYKEREIAKRDRNDD